MKQSIQKCNNNKLPIEENLYKNRIICMLADINNKEYLKKIYTCVIFLHRQA